MFKGLGIGEQAPDFTVPSTVGETSLSDFRGNRNVVLAFYPMDFTPT